MENKMINQNTNLSRLDTLAQEARMFAAGATMNMLQLGRVFIEAKTMLKHGEFAAWCDENAGCSIRTAQNMMSAYTRFGDKPEFLKIGKSKLFKMLTLPEGTEDQFVKENDVEHMSSREVDRAIKEARGDTEAVAAEEAKESEVLPPPDEKLVNELRAVKEERDRMAAQNIELLQQRNNLNHEISEMRSGSEFDAQMLQSQQETIDKLNDELNRYRVAEARGEVGRNNSNEMDADAFRKAVNDFMGEVHRIPLMGSVFATMDYEDRSVFDTLLKSIEAWTSGARRAINTIEGGFVS